MPAPTPDVITRLLDKRDFDQLAPLVQQKLKEIARQRLRELRPGATLDTSALIGELYDKLLRGKIDADFNDRSHFYALASQAMRNVLLNYARKKRAQKRGDGKLDVRLDTVGPVPGEERIERIVALDDALDRLAEKKERAAQVVELRYFGGLTVEETAEALDVSARTVKRDHRAARLWLARAMTP